MNRTETKRTVKLIEALREAESRGDQIGALKIARRISANRARRERDEAMRDLGMVKVRGGLGGTYWE